MTPALGVCYYPEHWDEALWAEDAARMIDTGISWVRIGEFAWSRLEPTPGAFDFGWLDRAIETLGQAGLKVVLGTPTATPPRWMIDRHPDMLAVDANGHPRTFGARRHYCFSHAGYRADSVAITQRLGERYGDNPYVAAWQIDNEYGCHDTVISYSAAAAEAFRHWLEAHYGDIDALNRAWGNVFWSMEYNHFAQIDPPNQTVTEPNPAHVLAFRRFSSDQVVAYNRAQAEALRTLTNRPLIHNYMGRILEFDHFEVGLDLDIASWDSYPIGFLSDRIEASSAHKAAYLRQGDPDMQAFHHDLYRSVGKGRWWVMEQQPGPVNWAPYNPAPLPGMVALWTLEAFAHGAEVVSYFRWRQAPFGQEQHHAGLLTPDNRDAPGRNEARQVADIIGKLPNTETTSAPVALIFDYPSDWAWTTQPQGAGFNYFNLQFDTYRALRRAGFSVDILPAGTRDFGGYKLVLAPGLAVLDREMVDAIRAAGALCLLGPRCGAITADFATPLSGRPDIPGLDLTVDLIETLPPEDPFGAVEGGGRVQHWFEHVSGEAQARLALQSGAAVLSEQGKLWYLSGCPDDALWDRVIEEAARHVGLSPQKLPQGLRHRVLGDLSFWINYNAHAITHNGREYAPCSVAIERNGVWLHPSA
ncbi:MAG: beta-galactosidase [Arenibacterium sp.]